MSSLPVFLRIDSQVSIRKYLEAEVALSRTVVDVTPREVRCGLQLWLETLAEKGHSCVSPALPICLLGLAERDHLILKPIPAEPGELNRLGGRLRAGISRFCALDTFSKALSHAWPFPGRLRVLREMLELLGIRMQCRAETVPAFDYTELRAVIFGPQIGSECLDLQEFAVLGEAFLAALEAVISDWEKEQEQMRQVIPERIHDEPVSEETIALAALVGWKDGPLAWDEVCIAQTVGLLKDPLLHRTEQQRLYARLPNLRIQNVRVRSHLPVGGYVGLRVNGGLEDLSSLAPSELALPRPMLLEKAFNKRLQVFERPLSRVRIDEVNLCLVVTDDALGTDHPAGQEKTPQALGGKAPAAMAGAVTSFLAESFEALRRLQESRVKCHLFLNGRADCWNLDRLCRKASIPGLPFFLDPSRSGILPSLFTDRLTRWAEDANGNSEKELRRLAELIESGGECHVYVFASSERLSEDVRKLQRACANQRDRGGRTGCSLSIAKYGPEGWVVPSAGESRGLARTEELVRGCLNHLLEHLLGIRLSPLHAKGIPSLSSFG